jgi:mannan endo-1,4-beta-mannosidase
VRWDRFRRRNLNAEIVLDDPAAVAAFGCGDADQAVVWLLRRALREDGRVDDSVAAPAAVEMPGMAPGARRVAVLWDTREGRERGRLAARVGADGTLRLAVPALGPDLALAVGEGRVG